jgi:putative ABC transport system ATP-binding protein
MSAIVTARGLTRVFTSGSVTVDGCRDIDLEVNPGELLVVRGPSGSGKTTLLTLLGTLDRPTAGSIEIDGVETTAVSEAELVPLRRRLLGFVFQRFALLPSLTAAENVELPLRLAGVPRAERGERVAALLDRVGIGGQARQRPDELSGGQQQRVGIARALVVEPRVLLADEPTGQLDSMTAAAVMDLIGELVHERGVAGIVTTHDPAFLTRADTTAELHDGRLALVPHGRHLASR